MLKTMNTYCMPTIRTATILGAVYFLVTGCMATTSERESSGKEVRQEEPAYQAPTDRKQLVQEVQSMLTDKGFDPGPADGIPGNKTNTALASFQRSRGYALTDGVTAEAHRQLALDKGGAAIATTSTTVHRQAPADESQSSGSETYTRADDAQAESGIYGNPPAGSPFSKIEIGMSLKQVTDLIGEPTDQNAFITGKAWIPFYYGTDRSRMEYRYKGQGVITFVGQSGFSSVYKVYRVIYNPEETGYNR